MTVLRAAVDALPGCRSADGELLTAPFLAACRLVLPVIDSLGPAFLAARSDVSGNIERLAQRAASSPAGACDRLFDIVRAEALLWLHRFLDFTVRLLAGLAAGPASELGPCAAAAYEAALRPFHGWATRALFAVVLAAAPYRATFERALGEPAASPPPPGAAASPAALVADERAFADAFAPLLADALAQLRALGQDDPTPV